MREDKTYLWAYARKGKTMKKKRIFAIAVAILMLVVSVVHVMAHDHEGEIELFTSNSCCSNPKRVQYVANHTPQPGGYCTGIMVSECERCGDRTEGEYLNLGPCVPTCYTKYE